MELQSLLEPLTIILLQWANKNPLSHPLNSLYDLTNAEFFTLMLSQVDGFRWIDGCQWSTFKDVPTGERVKRMRVIGRSISRYYQQNLNLSLDNLAFNYIDMCTNNPQSEILRLFIAALGILTQSQSINSELSQFLSELSSDEAQLFRIMIDYASRIGEKIGTSDSPLKRQKKLVSRLESIQEQLEFYQQYTEQLQGKVHLLTEQGHRFRKQLEEIKARGDRLVRKIELLQTSNQELNQELLIRARQEEVLVEKLAKNRQAAQEVVDRLLQENEKGKKEVSHFRNLLSEKIAEEVELRKIAVEAAKKQSFIQQLENKLSKRNQLIQKLEKEVSQTRVEIKFFSVQNEGLKTKIQLFEKSFPIQNTSFFSPEQTSIVIPNRLGDSYLQTTPKAWYPIEEDKFNLNQSKLSQSLSFSQPTQYSLSYPEHSGFMNLKQLQVSFKDKQNLDPNIPRQIKLSDIQEEKSEELPDHTQRQFTFEEELLLAMNVIFELQTTLHLTRKELLTFKNREAERAHRSALFASKVHDMLI